MPAFFHAVAIDYDGTLTERPRPSDDALAAVRLVRESGRKCLLVTGRILSELRADFPEVDAHFDAIVAENGAVLSSGRGVPRPLAPPVSPELEAALRARLVPLRRGNVLLATESGYGAVVGEEIGRLGLEVQVTRNRGALMVLPAGVTKGSGLLGALGVLGLSRHSTVAIGDAENDHSLLDACEIGVAVANAIEPLRAHADIVLTEPSGRGVAAFLRRLLSEGISDVEPRRWQVVLGSYDDGTPASVPASHVNIGIYGRSGSGKSYLAGLLAEQLIAMAYTICVLDLEGDQLGLATLHGAVAAGGAEPLPPPEQIVRLLRHGLASVVIDLSLSCGDTKRSYSAALLEQLYDSRHQSGIPHWIVIDEAHVAMPAGFEGRWYHDATQTGLCLVTYMPEQLCRATRAQAEVVVRLDADVGPTLRRDGWAAARRFRPAERATHHVRHWHKYTEGLLPGDRRFFFRDSRALTGRSAASVPEFLAEVRRARPEALRHHAAHRDFSRWLGDLLRETQLSLAVAQIEKSLASAHATDVDRLRARLVGVIEAFFSGVGDGAPPSRSPLR